jgi:hypothetical protein
MNNDFNVTYTFRMDMVNSGMQEHPDQTVEISFDATDTNIHVVLGQFETFLKASGYHFDHLEVVR